MTRTAAQVRQEFIDFFCHKHGHAFVPSSPVVPHDDPTLLFTNAGMNQFKPYFLGTETPKHSRVANTQKCIRAGGKHNDLDDVGHDTYHHTFFEMLGNWSFGDYFKKEAIAWAWELLVDVWGIDPTRLHATYFGGDPAERLEPDNEARDLWRAILPPERVHAGSKKDNFWEMGDTGPCGPCSEIHIDLTPDKSGAKLVNAGDARAIEIWNLVFIQFNRAADGKLTPLPAKHVDTGMGFERVTAVLQGHNNNYATDVFVPIIQAIEKISGHTYGDVASAPCGRRVAAGASPADVASASAAADGRRLEPGAAATGKSPSLVGRGQGEGSPPEFARYAAMRPGDMRDESCRVIADHIRCLTFAITDGAVPDKDGRGYVLRRILRRAKRFARQYLGLRDPILPRLAATVTDILSDAFPELRPALPHVQEILREEEESFESTLGRGIRFFNGAMVDAITAAQQPPGQHIQVYGRGRGDDWEGQLRLIDDDAEIELVLNGRVVDRATISHLDSGTLPRFCPRGATIRGEHAFKLQDTHGFPIDLTEQMAKERGLSVDIAEHERMMDEARERARARRSAYVDAASKLTEKQTRIQELGPSDDTAKYGDSPETGAHILGIFRPVPDEDYAPEVCQELSQIEQPDEVAIILDRTCFYAEQGGQVADSGEILATGGLFRVEKVFRAGDTVAHLGRLARGHLRRGDNVTARVTVSARRATMKNHTATHVMNWALREVLGDHVQQKGSLVDPDKTRFDFSHPKALTPEEIERVEQLVNDRIRQKLPVHYKVVPQHDALKINGLRAVFGERYPDQVRVMSVGVPVEDLVKNPDNPDWRKYSIEFCGGTHLKNTAEIEHFAITTEEAVAKGVRRIVAVTGDWARRAEETGRDMVQETENAKRGSAETAREVLTKRQIDLPAALIPLQHRHRLNNLIADLQAIVKEQHKSEAADAAEVVKTAIAELLKRAEKIGETTVVIGEMPDVPIEQLKMGADQIKQKCGSAAVLFGVRVASEPGAEAPGPDVASASAAADGRRSEREAPASAPAAGAPPPDPNRDRKGAAPTAKALLLAALTPDLVKRGLKAGDLVKAIAPIVGGGGGGPPTMAQAGGKQPEKLAEALAAGRDWIVGRLAT